MDNHIGPPLKWAGGKRWLVPHLVEYWEPYRDRRLVEPLCGGLAVALRLRPGRALLNDINPHLINFYLRVQKGLVISFAARNNSTTYYRYRDRFNSLIESGKYTGREAAGLFYYLNRTGYNGLCRFNRQGEFNVPFGRYARINYKKDFLPYKDVFSDWTFTSGDFEDVPLKPQDFVYADPPYDVEFTGYAKEGFSWDDQERLAAWLAKHRGPVILSNQATSRIVRLYKKLGFIIKKLYAPRMISCTGDRTPAVEVLALKGV